MKKILLLSVAIALLWGGTFAFAVLPNERQAHAPDTYSRIILPTQPRDPRDLLRGDFVVLQYDFARRSWGNEAYPFINDILDKNPFGTTVYVSFSVGKDRRATPIGASLTKPADGTFLRGKIYKGRWREKEIRFGIERFFVPKGKGWELEEAQRNDALEAEIAIHPKTGKGLVINLLRGKKRVDFSTIEPRERGW